MATVAGIDYSSRAIHIVLVDEDTGAWHKANALDLTTGPGKSIDRCRRIRDLMPRRSRWADQGVAAIGIEAPFSRQRNSIAALSRVQGAILACLPWELDVLDVTPQAWKRRTVGKTNASKDEVRDWAIANGASPGLAQDFYDAFSIARATRVLISETKGDSNGNIRAA